MFGVLSAGMGEVAPELTAELVADGAVPLDPVISPDGRWVAYVVTTMGVKERRVSALWVVPADASSPPRRLTPGTAWAGGPRWAPDSDSLLFGSGGQLYRIGVDGGDAEALASWPGGIRGYLPLAGRLAVVVAAGEPGEEDERGKADRGDALVWGEHLPGSRLWLLDLGSRDLQVVGGLGEPHLDLPAARCGPACGGQGLSRREPGADAGPAAPPGAARRRLDI